MSENENLPLPSVDGMLREMRGLGLSVTEIARMLDRSPRMISKVLRGESSGESYRAAVSELHSRGTVSKPPPRRRGADGHVVQVRAAGGATATPEDPAARRAPRGRFTEQTTILPGGGRMVELTAPKTKGTKGRGLANDEIVSSMRRAAQGQRHDRKKVKFSITTSDGRTFPVGSKGGYQVSDVLRRTKPKGKRKGKTTADTLDRLGAAAGKAAAAEAREAGKLAKTAFGAGVNFAGDALTWLKKQAEHRYTGMERGGVTITGVTMVVYNHSDEKQN